MTKCMWTAEHNTQKKHNCQNNSDNWQNAFVCCSIMNYFHWNYRAKPKPVPAWQSEVYKDLIYQGWNNLNGLQKAQTSTPVKHIWNEL